MVKNEALLLQELAQFSQDPLGFVYFSFTWGIGSLAGKEPDQWQIDILLALGAGLIDISTAIQIAVASGHGIGKSALVSWIILWAISTCPDTRGVVTANSGNQLKQKTWAELSKWHQLFIFKSLFAFTSTAIYRNHRDSEKSWRIDAVTWSIDNTEAFAGLHNEGKRIIILFDEASSIADKIWEVTEGALTDSDTEIMWICFGNPTRNSGRFRQCFGSDRKYWLTRQIDSRTVKITNKKKLNEWVEKYGEDSDFVRVRVRGEFPNSSDMQFIPSDLVAAARKREALCDLYDPLVLGVDVARFGSNDTILCPRKGRDARTIPWKKLHKKNTMEVAAEILNMHKKYRFDAIFIDGGGVGGGVVDRCRDLKLPVFDINFGGSSDNNTLEGDGIVFYNKRAEMYGSAREWLAYGSIPDDPNLEDQLCGVEYSYAQDKRKRDAILLESKEEMADRGLPSPDEADGLVLTFAYPVMKNLNAGREGLGHRNNYAQSEYDPFESSSGSRVQHDYDPYA